MEAEELRQKIEECGHEVKSIRVFKNSFHVNYWTKEAKIIRYYKVPISKVTWNQVRGSYQ